MWNPIDRIRQRRARRRFIPRPRRPGVGTTAKLAIAALVVIVGIAAVLEMRGGGAAERTLLPYAREAQQSPAELIATAGRRHRLVFLGDVRGAAAPKAVAAEAIRTLAAGSGLDAVVLEIPASEQPYLDQYFLTSPEDPGILLSRPRAVRESEGASRAWIELYRTIWQANRELGADRAIRVIAADLPDWPPTRALSPNAAGALFGQRDAFMDARVDSLLLSRSSRTRALFFVDGLHALYGGATLHAGGGQVGITWLAERMHRRYPRDVYTILTDAAPARAFSPAVVTFRSTGAWDLFRTRAAGTSSRYALPITDAFDAVGAPVRVTAIPGTTFSLQPGGRLRDLADGYLYLAN